MWQNGSFKRFLNVLKMDSVKPKKKGVKLGNKGLEQSKEKQIIKQYLQKELTVRKIANQLNISTATIYNVLKRNGIQINRKNHL